MNKIISNTNIPIGKLFYPCCGNDTYKPIYYFLNSVNEFHFVDIYHIPKLPTLQADTNGFTLLNDNITKKHDKSYHSNNIIIKSSKEIGTKDIDISNSLTKEIFFSTGYRNQNSTIYEEDWTTYDNKLVKLFCHKQDGLATFFTLDKISVFYLVRDSEGEGGSGQHWFSDILLGLILEKLVDGGLIVTDGSSSRRDIYKGRVWEQRKRQTTIKIKIEPGIL